MGEMPPLPGQTSTSDESSLMYDEGQDTSSTLLSNGSPVHSSTILQNTLSKERRKMRLIEKYSTGKTSEYSKSTMQSINSAVRKVLIPRMKFVSTQKHFGQFEQPDFSDESCWVHRVFDQLGNLKRANDMVKAEIWMTYRNKVKEQFSLHRSMVTNQLKKTLIKGKFFFT